MSIQYFHEAQDAYNNFIEDLVEKYNSSANSPEIMNSIQHEYYQTFVMLWKYMALKCESFGIVARGNFTCCAKCGHYEIDDERDYYTNKNMMTSYVFFHAQVMERVISQIIDDSVNEIRVEIYWGIFNGSATHSKALYDRFNDIAKKLLCRTVYQGDDKCFYLIMPKNESVIKYTKEVLSK